MPAAPHALAEALTDALSDVKSAVQAGENFADACALAADDYDLRKELIERKFEESFGPAWKVLDDHLKAQRNLDPEQAQRLLDEKIAEVCEQYRVKPTKTIQKKVRFKTYTLIARDTFSHDPAWIAVRHSDRKVVSVRTSAV